MRIPKTIIGFVLLGFVIGFICGCRTFPQTPSVIRYTKFEVTLDRPKIQEWTLMENVAKDVVDIKRLKVVLLKPSKGTLVNVEYEMKTDQTTEKCFILRLYGEENLEIKEYLFTVKLKNNVFKKNVVCFILYSKVDVKKLSLSFLSGKGY